MEYIHLSNGTEMPVLGFGTMRVKNLPDLIPEVIKAGYRLIDTAANYDNEAEVGKGIKRAVSDGTVTRDDLFITSKMQILTDGAKHTRAAVENSLKNLGLDYLDLYLIHQPYGDIYGEWRELEKLQREGKIKAIGVSNFEPFRLMDLMLHNEVKPAVNQIEVNLWYQEIKEQTFAGEHGIITEILEKSTPFFIFSCLGFAELKGIQYSRSLQSTTMPKKGRSLFPVCGETEKTWSSFFERFQMYFMLTV